MDEVGREWKGRTGGGNLGQRGLIWLLRHCGLRTGYFFMGMAIPFYMLFGRKGYRAIRDYYRDRHGIGGLRRLGMIYRNHYLFGQMILDRFSVFAGRENSFKVEVDGMEHFLRLADGPAGFIMASAHVGNFEILGYLLRQDRKKMNAIIYGGESQFLQQNRGKALGGNITMIPVAEDMSHLFAIKAALDNGEIVSMPADRMHGSAKFVECEFLGAPARFPLGVFRLAAQTGVEVLTVFVMKEPGQTYRIRIMPVRLEREGIGNNNELAAALARGYVVNLEEVVKRYPHQWFNFYDFWKN